MARPFHKRSGPVPVDAPQGAVQFVDPKTGNLSPHALKMLSLLWERSGAYDDDVFLALGLSRAGLTQVSGQALRLEEVEERVQAISGGLASVRGDPRLETAERAKETAETALVQAMAKGADLQYRVERLESLVERLTVTVGQALQQITQAQDQAQKEAEAVRTQQITFRQQINAKSFDLESKFEAPNFNTQVRAALSASGSIAFNATTGVFSYTQPTNVSAFTNDAGYLTGSAIGVTVQGYSANLAAFAGKTAPSGAVVGTTDAQTLTNKTLSGATLSGATTGPSGFGVDASGFVTGGGSNAFTIGSKAGVTRMDFLSGAYRFLTSGGGYANAELQDLTAAGTVRAVNLRIDQTPTAAAVAQTHHVPVSINGTTYKLLLAS